MLPVWPSSPRPWVSAARSSIQAGVKSRDKLVHITGLTPAQVAAALGLVSS